MQSRNQGMAKPTLSSYSVAGHRVSGEVSAEEDGAAGRVSPRGRHCVAVGQPGLHGAAREIPNPLHNQPVSAQGLDLDRIHGMLGVM